MKQYTIQVYTDNKMSKSRYKTPEQVREWLRKNLSKGLSFTVSEYIDRVWQDDLTGAQIRNYGFNI